jgi:hypothetical protein
MSARCFEDEVRMFEKEKTVRQVSFFTHRLSDAQKLED